jgi:hypothetical protein
VPDDADEGQGDRRADVPGRHRRDARGREKLIAEEVAKDGWRLFMSVESTPDRVQHMMYQFHDREHPKYKADAASARARFGGEDIALSDAIPAAYRQMDRLVGEVLEKNVRPGDTLIVCSDHGFQSFRRGWNLNNWLAEKGYLATRELTDRNYGGYLAFVDWSKTRAYAVGLGTIFLNLRGRGATGSSTPPAHRRSSTRSREGSAGDEGRRPRRRPRRLPDGNDSPGPYQDLEGDLMVGCEAGYRVGWSTTTAGCGSSPGRTAPPGSRTFDRGQHEQLVGDHVSVAKDLVPGSSSAIARSRSRREASTSGHRTDRPRAARVKCPRNTIARRWRSKRLSLPLPREELARISAAGQAGEMNGHPRA